MSALEYAAPSGPHPVGVRDGELVDVTYPALRPQDTAGRRLMVRVWYPAASAGGVRRPYVVGDELQVLTWGSEANRSPDDWATRLAAVTTHSVEGASIGEGPFPTLVFSHGAVSWVAQNTPMMEHLASHGYVVWSVAHPGEASGVCHVDGELVRYEDRFLDSFVAQMADPDYTVKLTGDVPARLRATPRFLDDRGMGPWARRWVDDMRAVIDAIEAGAITGPAGELSGPSDLDRLGLFGMSFGAAASASAAQQDERVKAVVNLDGGQCLSDLLDTDIRVPLLHLATDIRGQLTEMGVPGITTLDANEFFFEPLRSVGARADVHRFVLAEVTHLELSDVVLIPSLERARVLPAGGKVEPQPTIDLVNAFVHAHFDAVLLGKDTGFPQAQLDAFPSVHPIDLAPVREWAINQEMHS